jgi:plastocyanin
MLPVLLLAVAAVLAACSSSAGPGWTYAPPTEPPASQPAPSGDASAAPSGDASAAPSGDASAAPSGEAPSDGGEGGDVVTLTAEVTQFLEKELAAPADTPFVIRFDNRDAGIPHNVEIKGANGTTVWKGDIFNGAEVRDYQVPAIAAGTYQFVCTVHPNMVGTLTVGG